MSRIFNCIIPSYMGLYRVNCFKCSYTNNENLHINRYEEGDFVPVVSNNYIYDKNLLILDFVNHVVHIIESCKYKKTVRILGEVDSRVYKYFKSRSYMSIDIYGNILNINNIYDLYKVMNSYPSINIYLEEKKFLNVGIESDYKKHNVRDEALVVLDNINNYRANNFVLSGYVPLGSSSKSVNSVDSFKLSNELYEQITLPVLESFKNEFFDKECISSKINYILELFNINYVLEITKNGRIITYFSYGEKKVTHIDKIKKEIKLFIDKNEEEELNLILDIIFSNIFDDTYAEYIIDTISTILDIND